MNQQIGDDVTSLLIKGFSFISKANIWERALHAMCVQGKDRF
jgi:hypothetical protein